MKFRIILWFILFTVIITQFSGYDFFQLNQYAIEISKVNKVPEKYFLKEINIIDSQNSILLCHKDWLDFLQIDEDLNHIISIEGAELMRCSQVHMNMLRKLYPENLELASQAVHYYPNETFSLHWVVMATDPNTSNESKPIVEKILEISPKDGLAWRYLGIILLREGDIPGSIQAHINSCYNGDPGVNGCYNAGRLLEQEGQFEEALYYYRLSRWSVSKENANRLEAELSGN